MPKHRITDVTVKKISGERKTWLSLVGVALLTFCAGPRDSFAGKLDPSNWVVYNYSGSMATNLTSVIPLPPTGLHIVTTAITNVPAATNEQSAPLIAANQVTNLTDQNLSTYVTLSSPSVLLVDLGQTNVLDRVYLIGSTKPANSWLNYQANSSWINPTPPLGLIVVYVGNTPTTTNQVAAWTVPYDAGNPVETEADIRFSPAAGQFVRLELHTQVTWGTAYWPGSGFVLSSEPASTNVSWNVGELELYGFSGSAASETNVNAVVLPAGAPAPLALAASELSYYLGELTGLPHPIIPPANTNQYSGTLYQIVDLASLAPDYSTMMANISNGQLPTNVNATISGNVVTFKSWPYRCVLWSAWQFLESQGIRWVYPDAHGDYVPTNGLNLSVLPIQYTPPTESIVAQFDVGEFEPWSAYVLQSVRQEFLYPWRNHWTMSWCGMGSLGGREIPTLPAPNVTVNSEYTEGFEGYPHNFNSVLPNRILEMPEYTNWWGWASTDEGSEVNPTENPNCNNPTFTMDDPTLISWVATKMTNIAAAQPLACTWPLNIAHYRRPYNLLPLDASVYSQDPVTLADNGSPPVPDPVPWVKLYANSYSGSYFTFVTGVANAVQQLSPSSVPLVGALAYADVFLPPTNIPSLSSFPTNVQVEVCLYGSPNLPMNAPANSGEKAALDGWHSACSHLSTYDYALLHTDYYQTDPRLPVPLVAGTVDRAQYLASVGALDGGCQGNLTSLPYNPWNFYAYPRIRWNTNQTAAQLEQEFFTGYFGEAAAPMLAYYQTMENYQFTNNVNMYYLGYCYGITPGSFPIGILAEMETNLLAAEELATNWWVVSRVQDMADGFDWLVTNSPDGLKLGQDFSDTSSYPVLNPTTNGTAINLQALVKPSTPFTGNGAYLQNNGLWFMGAAAWIEQSFNITAGTYRLDVVANGVASSVGWGTMSVYLGPASGSAIVNSINNATYSFTFTVPAGVYDLAFRSYNWGSYVIDGVQITRL